MNEPNLVLIIDTLAEKVIDASKKEVRDIYSLAIRSTIIELRENSAINMIKSVYPKLLKGLRGGKDEVMEECLEILSEIFKKFGILLYKKSNLFNKDELMKVLTDLLHVQS